VVAPGYKYNMPDINAAIGLAQLEKAELFRKERQRCAEYYLEHLADVREIDLPQFRGSVEDQSWHLFPIIIKPEALITRNEFIEKIAEKGIGVSVHYKPIHQMSYYKNLYGLTSDNFPNTEKIWKGTVSLPIYPELTPDELGYKCSSVKSLVHN
jgi:dTDP-4-amino-4,6-dideoxygalactose transaminase